ncbi:MAG: bile acid:sodium symporter family protein [Patescibacteria group bacterium]
MNFVKFISHNSWIVIFVALVTGFVYPEAGLWVAPAVVYLLMILILLSTLDVKYRDILKQLHKVRIILTALIVIHIALPLLVLLFKPLVSDDIFLGLIIAAAIPSGLSVIFFAKLFKGLPSEALVITMLSNMLSPFIVPTVVYVLAREIVSIDILGMMWTIVKIVFIPLIVARLIRPTAIAKSIRNYSTPASLVLLFLIIIGLIAPLKSTILSDPTQSILVSGIVLVLIVFATVVGFMFGKGRQEKRTLLITCSYKNYTLATVTALTLFGPLVALPSILYTIMNNLILLPVQLFFKHRSKRS